MGPVPARWEDPVGRVTRPAYSEVPKTWIIAETKP